MASPSSTRSRVVELAAALEDRFGLVIDDEEFTGEIFETVGSLADFVDRKLADGHQQV